MEYTVHEALKEALRHLERIASHLREHDQLSDANTIGKLSVLIVEAVEEGVAHFRAGEDIISVVNTNSGRVAQTNDSAAHDIQQQAVVALMNEVKKEQIESLNSENRALQKLPAPIEPAVQPGSWAQVAGTVTTPGPSRQVAHLLSPISMTSGSGSRADQSSNDRRQSSGERPALPAASPDLPEAKAGIIHIHGRVCKDFYQYITTRIHEGALQEIRCESNVRTRVVFQNLSDAIAFFRSDQEMERTLGFGRIGVGYRVELTEVVDWNDDLRLMSQPIRERRRLSFARKKLFFENMTAEKWKRDVQALAGLENIVSLWVYNSGNATAVFTSTIVARKVLETFNKWKEYRNGYLGVSVTYSSDPCEKEVRLLSDNNRPNHPKYNHARRGMR
ncbi:hypothetical protein BDW62DRAFT_198509 [Aspergillus aurantiobrunneus]